jgi:hypothetical protein
MPVYLREAAATIEALLAASNKTPTEQPQEQTKKKLPFISKALWERIVRDIILENKRFCLQPFSTLSINSYIDACFNDFWEGDLQLIAGKVRWRAQITSAVSSLIACQIIERVPGMQKHYQVTEKTRQNISNHGH